MERIVYRKTLDVHKNGVQFLLQGFETADKLSRVIEINLMASGDAIDFPLEKLVALMYVTTPNATEPSINKCTIKDNKIIYEVLPIGEEGVTNMQLKLVESRTDGATSVLVSPKFAVEVLKSDAEDESVKQTATFTALEEAVAKAKTVYDERFLRMELTNDCIFKAYYADGTTYETDLLKKLFHNGNVLLSESYAHGGTGVRADEDTDNSMYYANVSKSEALSATSALKLNEEILKEVMLQGIYTVFSVDFETGEVEYVSPSFRFNINNDTGKLDVVGQSYTFDEEVGRVMTEWLAKNGVSIEALQNISSTHTEQIMAIDKTVSNHSQSIETLGARVTPIVNGGTGAKTLEEAQEVLGVPVPYVLWVNEKPSEEFVAQTIKLDLSKYGRIHVLFSGISEVVCTEKDVSYRATHAYGKADKMRRFMITNSGIVFENASYTNSTLNTNDSLIPYKIIGYIY